eukprot:3339674-Amphidinium_carterae.1
MQAVLPGKLQPMHRSERVRGTRPKVALRADAAPQHKDSGNGSIAVCWQGEQFACKHVTTV